MSRIKAAFIHFLVSLMIVFAIFLTMFTLWYPDEYFNLMGGKKLIYLIAGVDVLLGPLLTLAIFDSKKRLIKFDLTCIAIFQIAAMSYGLYVMLQARPIFTVFNKDAFYVASVVDIVPSELAKGAKQKWKTASLTGPKLVVSSPNGKNKFEKMFYETESQTGTMQQYPRFYDEYENHIQDVIKAGKPLSQLIEIDNKNRNPIKDFSNDIKRPIEDFLYIPIYSMTGSMSAIIDKKTGELIKIIDIEIK